MPVILPSGRELCLYADAILEPNTNWYRAPANHFWYETPDLKVSAPPFRKTTLIRSVFLHAPVPRNHAEVSRYIQVVSREANDSLYWMGDWLHEFPKYRVLTPADLEVFAAWINSDVIHAFWDLQIKRCRQNAAATARAQGFVLMRESASQDGNDIKVDGEIRNPFKEFN